MAEKEPEPNPHQILYQGELILGTVPMEFVSFFYGLTTSPLSNQHVNEATARVKNKVYQELSSPKETGLRRVFSRFRRKNRL